jgi:hypothetical protein
MSVRRIAVVIGAIVLVLLLVAWSIPMPQWCDGSAPVWVHAPGGCMRETRLIEYLYPWHWAAPTRCIGLCTNLVPSAS